MSDEKKVALSYVECYYINEDGSVGESKRVHYPKLEAEEKYKMAIAKLTKEGKKAFICLRSDDHDLITSFLVNYQQKNSGNKR